MVCLSGFNSWMLALLPLSVAERQPGLAVSQAE